MKQERKEILLRSFPPVPENIMTKIGEKKKTAQNFVVFLTRGDELFARCFHQYYNGTVAERQRYVFAKDGCCRYGTESDGRWVIRRDFREPVFCASYGYNFDNTYSVLNMDAINQSCMRYSCADKYHGKLLIEYLQLYIRHPNIEYLMKSGYGLTIEEQEVYSYFWSIRQKVVINSNINLKSNNLLKMLGLNRTEFQTLKDSECYYNSYICWRYEYPKYKPTELLHLAKAFDCEFTTAKRISEQTGVRQKRIARYLVENGIYLRDYQDYIRQCQELRYNLHDTAICMPKDFSKMHLRLSQIIKYNHSEKSRKAFEENYPARAALEYAGEKYFIRQPRSMDEISAEGKVLSHCVGGYADRHAKGTLNILFIRKIDAPDDPLYTMELSVDGEVKQVRGLRNCDPTKDAKAFVEEYKQYISPLFDKRQKARITA